MSISLAVDLRSNPVEWDVFIATQPGFKIALDGYVYGGPKFVMTKEGPYANFNHHEEVDRLATRATCAQVLLAIRQGLFSSFRKNNEPTATVFVNDCDEDVCLSWWLLNNHVLAQNTINPLINKLVSMEDSMDTTGGSYPVCSDLPFLSEMAWIFEPYRQFRSSGRLGQRNSYEYMNVIESVGYRITAYVMGHGRSVALDTSYSILYQGSGWHMVSEEGAHARNAMFQAGIRSFVSVSKKSENAWTYTVGKFSQFITTFDIPQIMNALNEAERRKRSVDDLFGDRWGGSNIIGGSPRVSGSVLTPREVFDTVSSVVANTTTH